MKSDGKDYLERILSYAEKLMHKDFYNQIQDIVEVGLARYKDKYSKPYRQKCPFVLYEKYSRRDVSLLMNAGKDLSSTMYGMTYLSLLLITKKKIQMKKSNTWMVNQIMQMSL